MRPLSTLVVLLSLLAAPLSAQKPSERLRLTGMTFDRWGAEAGPALLRPTIRFSNFRGSLGSDFAIAIFPDGILLRPPFVITAGLEGGMAYRVPVGPASVLLEGGGAAIVSAGFGGDQLLYVKPGVHYGVGLLLPLEARALIRAGLTRHHYRVEERTVGMWSVGVGIVVGRRR